MLTFIIRSDLFDSRQLRTKACLLTYKNTSSVSAALGCHKNLFRNLPSGALLFGLIT
jgi:hypothetical protein